MLHFVGRLGQPTLHQQHSVFCVQGKRLRFRSSSKTCFEAAGNPSPVLAASRLGALLSIFAPYRSISCKGNNKVVFGTTLVFYRLVTCVLLVVFGCAGSFRFDHRSRRRRHIVGIAQRSCYVRYRHVTFGGPNICSVVSPF
ncbi:hypothetical protein BD310DRAFT_917668 [Dichomitus squalens]|uniref:Uncharacterized protein n=1 Tax=Dichomitus squalens TaxID=114155 RepID=A0A4Q9Q7R9_9APHY|nr:hypothetical protein BD310DRAFT_917668 [Dichomitus squalens]